MNFLKKIFTGLLLVSVAAVRASEPDAWQLLPQAQVDSTGIFLDQIVVPPTATVVPPHLRLAPAPSLGQTASFSRKQITELAQNHNSEFLTTNWSGATQIRVSRRIRQLSDSDLIELLTAEMQKEFVKDRGELELHLTRPWVKVPVPDEPLTLKLAEMPSGGVSPNFVVTFELWNGRENVGSWQVALQALVWRDVPVARSALQRGEPLKDADIEMERRDVLIVRDVFPHFPTTDDTLELAESIQSGMPILNRSVRTRPVILRGRVVDAVFQEGSLSISLKVETLEDGLLGQTVRVRNPKTRRELYGKVQNEQTVLIAL
jgi:flagella basal body P-ring formation protein FlgA